jgi:hypothetical protein
MNGCTYVGKHHQIKENDKYVTSSSYYHNKGGEDILYKREILLDNLPDEKTCEIMETICILRDRAENINNVNYNKGGWVSNHFDRGFSGKENGMYGIKMTDIMGEEAYKDLVRKQKETRRKKYLERNKDFIDSHNGMTPQEYKNQQKQKQKKYNSALREINKQIKEAHKAAYKAEKSRKHYWCYNPETLVETYLPYIPEGYVKGRIPHSLWSEERKKSYADKHSFNPLTRMTAEAIEERSQKISESAKGRICVTDGVNNKYLMQGDNIPDGWWLGCTFEKTPLYINTRKKKGYNNKGEKVNG